MLVKTSELQGAALDWAAAAAKQEKLIGLYQGKCWYTDEIDGKSYEWNPSTNWAQGGPIIEREHISFYNFGIYDDTPGVRCEAYKGTPVKFEWRRFGKTPLIAAMRCYVASMFGDEVDIPEGL